MSRTPETDLSPAAAKPLSALRAFVKSRRFKGLGLLLFYCHMLMLFAFMGKLYLPGVTDLVGAIGVSQAWQTGNVQSALGIINDARSGIGAVKNDAASIASEARLPGSLDEAKEIAGSLSASETADWLRSTLGRKAKADTDDGTPSQPPAQNATATQPDALGQLPDLTSLSGLPLAGKISSALVPVMFLLTMLCLPLRFLFKISLWLGLGHAALSFILLGRAALSLTGAPDLYISCLTPKLQNFASGGFILWLAALLALCALLAVTAWVGRKAKI